MSYYIFSALQQAPPTFTKDSPWKQQINVTEKKPFSVIFSLHGNPQPEVTVKFADINFNVTNATLKDYVYKFTAIGGSAVDRSHCNKTLKVTAVIGSLKPVEAQAQVIVDCEYSN